MEAGDDFHNEENRHEITASNNDRWGPPFVVGVAGEVPFGICGTEETYGFAVCRYDNGALYRFSCDRDWETVNDSPHEDEAVAMASLPLNYEAARERVRWRRGGE